MANRNQKARMLRERRKGKFKNWKNNPRGGTQAPLKRYSMKRYTTPSQDVELFHNQTLGARAAAADNTVRVPLDYLIDRIPRDPKDPVPKHQFGNAVFFIKQPETKDLTFARVIGQDGPIPRLIVLDRLKQVDRKDWFMDWEYEKWVNEYYHITLIKALHHRVDILFRGQEFIIVEVMLGMARRSKVFDTFERAKRAWERWRTHKSPCWVETIRV